MEETTNLVETSSAPLDPDAGSAVPETIDYMKELYLQGQQRSKDDKKKLRLMRLCVLLMAVIAATLIAAVVLAGPKLSSIVNDFHTITVKVDGVDVDSLLTKLSDTLTAVNGVLEDGSTALNSVNDVAVSLSSFDVDALNDAIGGLDSTVAGIGETVKTLGDIDIEGLNTSIDQLEEASAALAALKILSIFGG